MSIYSQIDDTAQGLSRKLGIKQKPLAKILTHWTKKSPPNYGEDVVQDIAISLLEQRPDSEWLAYSIARHVVGELWRRYHTRAHYGGVSLDETVNDETGSTLASFIAGSVDYEAQICGNITCSEIFKKLPDWMQECVSLRLNGHNVNGRRAANMKQWAKQNAHAVLA